MKWIFGYSGNPAGNITFQPLNHAVRPFGIWVMWNNDRWQRRHTIDEVLRDLLETKDAHNPHTTQNVPLTSTTDDINQEAKDGLR